MSATYDLFTRWKAAKKLPSDNAGAVRLGVTRGTVSLWKQGRNAAADVLEKMAGDLGEDAMPWIALAMAEQTQGDASRTWTRVAKRFGAAAALTLCVVAVGDNALIPAALAAVSFPAMPIM